MCMTLVEEEKKEPCRRRVGGKRLPVDNKPVTKRVIEYKDDVTKRAFKIGHKKKSETFLPSIQIMTGVDDTYIIDMAGLKDLDGHLTEITN